MRKALLLGVASLAIASAPAQAAEILFSSSGNTEASQTVTEGAVTQIRLESGAVVSIVGPAEFSLEGEEIAIARGGVTVAGANGAGVVLRLPSGADATVTGSGSLAVRNGQLSGNVMAGSMQVTTGSVTRTYRPGQSWAAAIGGRTSRVIANAAQPSPSANNRGTRRTLAQVAMTGLPVTLGDALAGAGAEGDVVAAARGLQAYLANPALARIPSGGIAKLLAYSDRLAAALGNGSTFQGSSPALVNAYLQFLANDGQIGQFQSAYASLVSQYLTLLANGGLASDFTGVDVTQLNSYLDYLQLTGQLGQIGAAQQNLLSAYLQFLRGGGVPNEFVVPANILGEDAIAAYVSAIQAYVAFLQSGGVPSEYAGLSASVFQAYLEALSSTGLFDTLLSGQADFLNAYLAFLQGGGNIDEFDQLPQTASFPVPQGQLASNQFMALRGSKSELAPYNGQIDRSRSDVIYDETTGAPLYFKFGTTRAAIGEAQLIEAGRISAGGVSWGRWVNGTAYAQTNTELDLGANGIHVIAGPMVTNMPTTGLIEYDFVGGTNPTLTGGEVGSLSVAKAAISFGSTTRVGAELKTDFSDRSYTLQTIGGIAQTALNGIALREDLAPGFFFGEVQQTTGGLIEVIGTGAACQGAGGCTGEIRGYISGDEAAELAISYIASDPGGAEVLGTAGFAKGGAISGGGSSGGGSNGGGGLSTDLAGANFDVSNAGASFVYPYSQPNNSNTLTRKTILVGELTRAADGTITEATQQTSSLPAFENLATALIDQRGDDRSLLMTYAQGDIGFYSSIDSTLGPAVLATVANAASFLPVSGTATYDLLYKTPVYSLDAGLGEGVFDAQMAISFGTLQEVALEGTLTFDTAYSFSTPGGLANPAPGKFALGGPTFGVQTPLTGTGELCSQSSTCGLLLYGVFSDDYERIATSFSTTGTSTLAYGAAIFGTDTVTGLSTDAGTGQSSGALTAPFGAAPVNLAFVDAGGLNRAQNFVSQYVSSGNEATFDARGIKTVTFSGITVFDRGTLSTADLAGAAGWQVGRFNGGMFASGGSGAEGTIWGPNNGYAYAAIAPLSGSLPGSGKIAYALLGATSPTYSDGSTAPGSFTGSMALDLPTQKIGLSASVTMADGGYSFATTGGAASPQDSQILLGSNFRNFYSTLAVTPSGSGAACGGDASGCQVRLVGAIGGTDGSFANLSYLVNSSDLPNAPSVSGAAAFGGTYSGGPPPIVGTEKTDQIVIYSATTIGIDSRENSRVTYDDTTGAPLAYVWETNTVESPTIGNTTQNDSGSVADVIGWTRWADGTTGGRYFNDEDGIEMPANGGWHIVAGDPATNLPTSGTVQYALIGSTDPTIRDGSLTPGTFSGELAVAFGATPKVGVEFDVAIGGNSYAINTPGGVADPMAGGMALDPSDMRFGTNINEPVLAQGSGPACGGSGDCQATINGFLSGDGGTYAGVVYTFGNAGFDQQIDGSAVFGVAPTP